MTLRAGLYLTLFLAIGLGQWRWLAAADAQGYSRRSAEVNAAALEAERENQVNERKRAANVMEAINEAAKREQLARRTAAAVRAERDGLRGDLYAIRRELPTATTDAARQRAATLAELFAECSGAVEGMAAKAQGHASDSLTFQQAWPR